GALCLPWLRSTARDSELRLATHQKRPRPRRRGDVALCLCWSARPYNPPRTPHALGLAQWLNGRRDSGARPRAGFCPPREPYGRLRARGALTAWTWVRTLRRVSGRQLARRLRALGCELARPRLGMTGRPKCLDRSAR